MNFLSRFLMNSIHRYLSGVFLYGCSVLLFGCDGTTMSSTGTQKMSGEQKADEDSKKDEPLDPAAAKPGVGGGASVANKDQASRIGGQSPGSSSNSSNSESETSAQGASGQADIPQPPENITGIYLSCNLPLATGTSVGINCRIAKNGSKSDDSLLLATGVWRFKSNNTGLATPKITKNPNSPDSHVSYVFEGNTSLSAVDLQNSSIELEYTYNGIYKGILSTSYRPECKTYKSKTEVCLAADKAAIRPIQSVSWLGLQTTPPSVRYDFVYGTGITKGILVIIGAPGASTITFHPTDGVQYAPGTLINNERIFLAGSETSKIDYDITLNTRYTLKTCTFDEFRTYSGICLTMSYVPGT